MNPRFIPTLHLLNASTVVAIAAGFRLQIAFLLAGLAIRIPECFAFALIMYATYTLDRALGCEEDTINRTELCGASKKTGLIACLLAFLAGTVILVMNGIYLAPFLPFLIGFVYSHGIRVGSFSLKLKGGLGMKNIVVGLTWGGTIALIAARWCDSLMTILVILLFFGSKTFVTSCVNDFKDVRGDIAAGIRTLPASLGENLTKKVLILVLLIVHTVMAYALLTQVIRNDWIIILYSLIPFTLFLLIYSSALERSRLFLVRKLRDVIIYYESAITVAVRVVFA